MAVWRRGPKLLGSNDLPPGFVYPPELLTAIRDVRLQEWEWLQGYRLRESAAQLWRTHPRTLVPFAIRSGTPFVVCFDQARPHGDDGEVDVVTVNATVAEAEPVQHLPNLGTWLRGAREEEAARRAHPSSPAGPAAAETHGETGEPPPGVALPDVVPDPEDDADPFGWVPPERGRCACVHHLDDFVTEVVPYGRSAPAALPPQRVGELVMAHEIDAVPDHPGPEVVWRKQRIGPFHWRARLGQGARLHLDTDGRVSLDFWLMRNPGVELVVWPDRSGDLHLAAPGLCRDGVVTLLARALLDDRVRRRR